LEHIRIKAEEDVEAELFTSYGTDPDRMISAIQKEGMIALKIAQYLKETKDLQAQLSGQGGPDEEDPLIKLKEQELNQRAQNDQARLALDQQKQQETMQLNQQKLQLQQAKIDQQGGQYAG
jgi:polyphosphate kinase